MTLFLSVAAALLLATQGGARAPQRRTAPAVAPQDAIGRATSLVAEAQRLLASDASRALSTAQSAEEASRNFDPAAFTQVGGKGEILGTDIDEAQKAYRVHRASVYSAWGQALRASNRPMEAEAVLLRAWTLEPTETRASDLAEARMSSGQPALALAGLVRLKDQTRRSLALIERIVDELRLPSAQIEIDLGRLSSPALKPFVRRRPSPNAGVKASLSSGAPLRFDTATPSVFYFAKNGCATCSKDLEWMSREKGLSFTLTADMESTETTLRRATGLYRTPWPVLVGGGTRVFGPSEKDSFIVVARGGHLALGVSDSGALAEVMRIVSRVDVQETRPRPGSRPTPSAAPATADVVGEPEFSMEELPSREPRLQAARDHFSAGRYAEALTSIRGGTLATDGLPPSDRRLFEAICMSRLGRTKEARTLLIQIGDLATMDRVQKEIRLIER